MAFQPSHNRSDTVGGLPNTLPALTASAMMALSSAAVICSCGTRADTPAQAIQAACDRAAARNLRRDLAGFMAMCSPDLAVRGVAGGGSIFRRVQASVANSFADDHFSTTVRSTVSQVLPLGDHAQALTHWHSVTHHARSASAPPYTLVRDCEEHSVWKELPGGWHEVNADMVHDVMEYRR